MQKVEKKKDVKRRADIKRKFPCREVGYCTKKKSMNFRVRILHSRPILARPFSTFVTINKLCESSKPHVQIGVNHSLLHGFS